MGNFGIKDKNKEYQESGFVSYTLEAPAVVDVELYSVSLEKSGTGTAYMKAIFTGLDPVEGLTNADTGNRQYASNSFYLTEKTLSMDNTANPQNWFDYLADKVGGRDEYQAQLESIGTNEEFVELISTLFVGKQFSTITKLKKYTKTNGKPGATVMLPVFGTIARTIENRNELVEVLEAEVLRQITLDPKLQETEDKNLTRTIALSRSQYVEDDTAPTASTTPTVVANADDNEF